MRLFDDAAQANRWRDVPTAEKLCLALGTIVLCLTSSSWIVQGLAATLMMGLTTLGARVPVATVALALVAPLVFIATSSLVLLVSLSLESGQPFLSLVKPAERDLAAFIALRAVACVSALLFLALTTPLPHLLKLFQRIGAPPELTEIATAMFRLIWLLLDRVQTGHGALAARLGLSTNQRRLKAYGLLLAAMVPHILSRARRLDIGLSARGYTGRLSFLSTERPASKVRLTLLIAAMIALGLTARALS